MDLTAKGKHMCTISSVLSMVWIKSLGHIKIWLPISVSKLKHRRMPTGRLKVSMENSLRLSGQLSIFSMEFLWSLSHSTPSWWCSEHTIITQDWSQCSQISAWWSSTSVLSSRLQSSDSELWAVSVLSRSNQQRKKILLGHTNLQQSSFWFSGLSSLV